MIRPALLIPLLAVILLVVMMLSLSAGAVAISWSVIINTLFDLDGPQQSYIILKSRLPRMLLAVLTGGSLAMSGVIIQALLRNPLASPKIIGINGGAALAICLMILAYPDISMGYLPLAAIIGALVAAAIVYLAGSIKTVSPARLALIGIAVGFLCDAGVDYILVSSPPYAFSTPMVWLTGSLWARGWAHIGLVWHGLIILMILAMVLTYRLDLIRLGDANARALGVNLRLERLALLAVAAGLAALSVSVAGVLGFVGLMAPHLGRALVGDRHKILMPVAMLLGMVLVVSADAIGRMILPPVEVSAGILTALFGAPFFIVILIKNSKRGIS